VGICCSLDYAPQDSERKVFFRFRNKQNCHPNRRCHRKEQWGTSAAMNDQQIMASIWFIATVGYRVWAYKQSVPILIGA
jgi:hypothetical protein